MAPELSRNNDRSAGLQHYTMKTSSRPPLASPYPHHAHNSRHMQSNMHSFRSNKTSAPQPVGQPYPLDVKLSPNTLSDGRTPSPNYFGLSIERHGDLGDSVDAPFHNNWGPHGLSVKSFNAAIPKQVSVDANPEFEAFRRQVDANRATAFNLSSCYFAPSVNMPRLPIHQPTPNQSDDASDADIQESMGSKHRERPGRLDDAGSRGLHESIHVSPEAKSYFEAPLGTLSRNPMHLEAPAAAGSPSELMHRGTTSYIDDRKYRLSLPANMIESLGSRAKSQTGPLPPAPEFATRLVLPGELQNLLRDIPERDLLILDVRVATHYAQSRIRGALNLCIPTTLLKRPAFNLDRLRQTLHTTEDQAKFSEWVQVKHLIIYDATSSETRDATAAMNLFKKFTDAGFEGRQCLLKGGYTAFAAAHPTSIDNQSTAERGGTSAVPVQGSRPSFAPVIGGVALPSSANHPNPFFGNIRQNMDLADGVGQLEISVPSNLDYGLLPSWLREATKKANHGKIVSDRFLQIERNEQTRMRDAYSAFNPAAPLGSKSEKVQLCGVEKGAKNRYKDILPFEHSRVRLASSGSGGCDYINASYIQASRSYKRYIAAQGPLPATFEDFWSVIWDHDVRVIVMLTAEEEGGQLKCHPYWRGREFGPIRLKCLSEDRVVLDMDMYKSDSISASSAHGGSESGRRRAQTTTTFENSTGIPTQQQCPQPDDAHHVIIRRFALSHASKPFEAIREITHIHYPTWPDFGTPTQPSHLLALVELANTMQRSAYPVNSKAASTTLTAAEHQSATPWANEPELNAEARPMLVHCSAGCGRTGTFCTVDSVVDILKRQKLDAPIKTVQTDMDGDTTMEDQATLSEKPKRVNWSKELPTNSETANVNAACPGEAEVDLIEATVEDFRKQRLSMVQSLRQFVLCYESVTEWLWRSQGKPNSGANIRGRFRSGSLHGPR
ncbi:hypothetical protein GGR50DRAFT_691089 [Xylaria sp. CBS 124048]|nr:hypothetical protein GGR50DRAFT_691089 [Xylaria sp. CBS 124048]